MIKYFKTFFSPPVVTYSYKQSKEVITDKIQEILYRKLSTGEASDIRVMFLSDKIFAINSDLPSRLARLMFHSTLVGEIVESKKGFTNIKTKARPGFGLYFLFILAIIFGSIYFYKFIASGLSVFLFGSLTTIIVGAALSIGISHVAIASIRQRYEDCINDDLKPVSSSVDE